MTVPKIPTSVRVGSLTYTVSDDRTTLLERSVEDASRLMGQTDHAACTIVIDGQLAECQKRDTVFHEVIHTAVSTVGLSDEWGIDKEEAVVRRLTPTLLSILRDNPALVAYLTAADQ